MYVGYALPNELSLDPVGEEELPETWCISMGLLLGGVTSEVTGRVADGEELWEGMEGGSDSDVK